MKKENIKIILSRTWSPGNIGSILRSMKNFDFTNIVAVNQINFDNEEMLTMAAGAKDHIVNLKNSENITAETDECNVIYAFSARKRKHYKVLSPRAMADEITGYGDDVKVGLLFGNETNGLNNEEIDLADKTVIIPTSKNYSSLNLANSVLIALYEINQALMPEKNNNSEKELIDHRSKEELFDLAYSVIGQNLMHRSKNQEKIKENIRHLLKRVNLNKKEQGFVTSILNMVDIVLRNDQNSTK